MEDRYRHPPTSAPEKSSHEARTVVDILESQLLGSLDRCTAAVDSESGPDQKFSAADPGIKSRNHAANGGVRRKVRAARLRNPG